MDQGEEERMDQSEFEKDLHIDSEQLDVECLKQSEIFFKWAQRSIEAKGMVDQAKLSLEVIEAQLQMEARKKPHRFGLPEKVTEAGIQAAVQLNSRYQEAHSLYLKMRDDSTMLDKAVAAMEMKKRMLEQLIVLHGQQYFAGPREPRDLGKAWALHRRNSEKRVVEKQKKFARKRGSE
jgi:hypothetical protein